MTEPNRYEFGAAVTDLHCVMADITTYGDRLNRFAPVGYSFNVSGLRVPVNGPTDLPMPGSNVRITIEWDVR